MTRGVNAGPITLKRLWQRKKEETGLASSGADLRPRGASGLGPAGAVFAVGLLRLPFCAISESQLLEVVRYLWRTEKVEESQQLASREAQTSSKVGRSQQSE